MIDPKDWDDAVDMACNPQWYWLKTNGIRLGMVFLCLSLLGGVSVWVYASNYESCQKAKQAEGYSAEDAQAICHYESEQEVRRLNRN